MKIALLLFLLSGVFVSGQGLGRFNANVGAGPAFPVGDSSDRINTGYNISAGAGMNLSRHLGFEVDYLFSSFDLSNRALAAAGAPDGYAHNWGFSFNPIFHIAPDRKIGAYVLAGYGVFTRTVNLTRPGVVPGVICDPWTFICFTGPVYADIIYRSNSTTKGGWDIGGGVTYRLGEGRTKVFTEIRYYDVLTRDPRTTFLPLTFGLRW
jgi:opacity protein-like surface antigen